MSQELIIKDTKGYRLKIVHWKCQSPKDLNAINIIQESKNDNGEVKELYKSEFFMTDKEVLEFANKLGKVGKNGKRFWW